MGRVQPLQLEADHQQQQLVAVVVASCSKALLVHSVTVGAVANLVGQVAQAMPGSRVLVAQARHGLARGANWAAADTIACPSMVGPLPVGHLAQQPLKFSRDVIVVRVLQVEKKSACNI